MALTVCNNCGKKVSDTVEKCIHCGAPIGTPQDINCDESSSQPDGNVKKDFETDTQKDTEGAQKPAKKYFSLSSAERGKLEEEFLYDDKMSMKWYRKSYVSRKIRKLGAIGWFMHLFLMIVFSFVPNLDMVESELNQKFAVIGLCCALVLMFGGLLTVIISVILNIIWNRKIKIYIYLRRFERWLAEKKDIDYNMSFESSRDRMLYDSIDVNTRKL